MGDLLVAALDAGTRMVLALRADFYGRLADHQGLARRAGPATVLVSPPDEPELRRIVSEPAIRVGLHVEPALIDMVVDEVRGRPGVLPVLSTALVRAWENRDGDAITVASYQRGGGVAAALQRVGEDVWATLTDEQRVGGRRILLRLAAHEDGRWVRRRAPVAELRPAGDLTSAAALDALARGRLVVTRTADVEIAHEALLTGWPRLLGWLEDAQAQERARAQLAEAALAWVGAGRDPAELSSGARLQAALEVDPCAISTDSSSSTSMRAPKQPTSSSPARRARADREARGRRRLRAIAAGLAVTLLLAAITAGVAVSQRRAAQDATALAQEASLSADAQRLGALASGGDDIARNALLAAEGVRLDPDNPTTRSNLLAVVESSPKAVRSLGYHTNINDVAASPDGHTLVASTGATGRLLVSDLRTGRRVGSISLHRPIGHIGWTPDGRGLAVGIVDSPQGPPLIEIVDPRTGVVMSTGPRTDPYAWTFTRGGRWLVSTNYLVVPGLLQGFGDSSGLVVWRPGSPASTATSIPLGGTVTALTSCGTDTVCALHDRELRRVGLPHGPARTTGNSRRRHRSHAVLARRAAGRPRSERSDRAARQPDRRPAPPTDPAPRAALHRLPFPGGTRLAAHDVAGTVLVWDLTRRGLPETLRQAGDDAVGLDTRRAKPRYPSLRGAGLGLQRPARTGASADYNVARGRELRSTTTPLGVRRTPSWSPGATAGLPSSTPAPAA